MFSLKKYASAVLSVLFFAQQAVFASPLEGAIRRDLARFPAAQEQQGEIRLGAAALKRLENFNKKTDGSWQIRLNRASGSPRALTGGRGLKIGKGEGAALSFLSKNSAFLGVERKNLKLKLQRKSAVGQHYYFEQYYKGLKVETAYVKVNVGNDGGLLNYQSTYIPDIDIPVKPAVDAASAASTAAADASGAADGAAQLAVYPSPLDSKPLLAWKITVNGGSAEPGKWTYYVDAQSGALLNRVSNLRFARETFKAKLNPVYPGYTENNADLRSDVPLTDMEVYYFYKDNGIDKIGKTYTDSTGKTAANIPDDGGANFGRVYTLFRGKYFSIANQNNTPYGIYGISGYYFKKGFDLDPTDPNKAEPISLVWSESDVIGNYNTYYACADAAQYPALSAPQIKNMNVGAMTILGAITNPVFLQFTYSAPPPLPSNQILAKYIGRPGNMFLGPIVPNFSNSQTMTATLSPSGGPQNTYEIDKMSKLCVPRYYDSNYTT
ncbi:MAG: PepSY domain-containing protein, partial [Elusimicrobiota bacterium]|nr:PepSY domain-containing protein [Elusimicrobiota bacterium]